MFFLTAGIDLSGIHPPSYSVVFAILCAAVLFFCFAIIAEEGALWNICVGGVVLSAVGLAGYGIIAFASYNSAVSNVERLILEEYGLDAEQLPEFDSLPQDDYLSDPIVYTLKDVDNMTVKNVELFMLVKDSKLTFAYGNVGEKQQLEPLTGNIHDVLDDIPATKLTATGNSE